MRRMRYSLATTSAGEDMRQKGAQLFTNLKGLIARLNTTCRSALEAAAGLCLSRTHYDVEIEHMLLKLLEASDTDLVRIFRHFEIDTSRLTRDLTRALDRLKTGNARTPALSPRLPRLFEEAWAVASIDYGDRAVRSSHLLLAFLAGQDTARMAHDLSPELKRISVETLQKSLPHSSPAHAKIAKRVRPRLRLEKRCGHPAGRFRKRLRWINTRSI